MPIATPPAATPRVVVPRITPPRPWTTRVPGAHCAVDARMAAFVTAVIVLAVVSSTIMLSALHLGHDHSLLTAGTRGSQQLINPRVAAHPAIRHPLSAPKRARSALFADRPAPQTGTSTAVMVTAMTTALPTVATTPTSPVHGAAVRFIPAPTTHTTLHRVPRAETSNARAHAATAPTASGSPTTHALAAGHCARQQSRGTALSCSSGAGSLRSNGNPAPASSAPDQDARAPSSVLVQLGPLSVAIGSGEPTAHHRVVRMQQLRQSDNHTCGCLTPLPHRGRGVRGAAPPPVAASSGPPSLDEPPAYHPTYPPETYPRGRYQTGGSLSGSSSGSHPPANLYIGMFSVPCVNPPGYGPAGSVYVDRTGRVFYRATAGGDAPSVGAKVSGW